MNDSMTFQLPYGNHKQLSLSFPEEASVSSLSAVTGEPVDDPAAAVAASLINPLDFPSLAKAVVPGDHVVVVIEPGLPQLPAIAVGAVHQLLQAGILAEDITIMLADAAPDCLGTLSAALESAIGETIAIRSHRPDDDQSLCYLAASHNNRPIYINRIIFDADFVLPIGCLHPRSVLGYYGAQSTLFPAFSDEKTRQRFCTPGAVDSAVQTRLHREEIEEVAWLLGIQLMVQVVPGYGDTVQHLMAGSMAALQNEGQNKCDAVWLHPQPESVEMVIATIEGGNEQQTWQSLARALNTARSMVAPHGAIVLCTELSSPPGPALRYLMQSTPDQETLREIHRCHSSDAIPAAEILRGTESARVYLLSNLQEEEVEDLGIGFVANSDQVNRLVEHCTSCILLRDAHRAACATVS